MNIHLRPGGRLAGLMCVPPSKSMAHRMLICAALAQGDSCVYNLDYSADINATISALRLLGADIRLEGSTAYVKGISSNFPSITQPVNCVESGSTLRFIIPIFSLTGQQVDFTGAPRLFARPLGVYEDIFSRQNLSFNHSEAGLSIQGVISPGEYTVKGDVSSQFISGLLFVLPLLNQDSQIKILPPFESRSYVELTIQAQKLFGVACEFTDDYTINVKGNQQYKPCDVKVEGDWSQAAVPAAIAAVTGSIGISGAPRITKQGDHVILDIIKRCGAEVSWQGEELHIQPPAGGLVSPGDIDMSNCPDLGPVVCALALFCNGTTRLINAGRLRIKESDRIASVEQELRIIGGQISSDSDSITILGGHGLTDGQTTQSHNDHRVVMALSVAAICGSISLCIQNAEAISKSWPDFFDDLRSVGAQAEEA